LLTAPDNCNASYAGTPVYKNASELIEQEIYFATQTFSGAVKARLRQITGNDQAGCRCQAIVAALLRRLTDVSVARSP
jgi:hypothetical protein